MEIIFDSQKMRQVVELSHRVAISEANVVLQGETGTGKELIAHLIHEKSARSQKPFIAVDCGALHPTLIESELFGHVKGSFTGASVNRRGLFEEADGGTLFLDEISEIPFDLQARLLRAIEYRQIRRVGSNRTMDLDLRVISASNQDLGELIRWGKFRQDLYFRLNTVSISIPPLKERREDVKPLVLHYLEKFSRKIGKPMPFVSAKVMEALLDYTWPGNVRELQNVIERAVVLSKNGKINLCGLHDELRVPSSTSDNGSLTLRDREEQHIVEILRQNDGNQMKTAQMLGISYTTLWRKLKKLNGGVGELTGHKDLDRESLVTGNSHLDSSG